MLFTLVSMGLMVKRTALLPQIGAKCNAVCLSLPVLMSNTSNSIAPLSPKKHLEAFGAHPILSLEIDLILG